MNAADVLRVRVPAAIAPPTPGWIGPGHASWFAHLVHVPLVERSMFPGLARLIEAGRDHVALCPLPPLDATELSTIIESCLPPAGVQRRGDHVLLDRAAVPWARLTTVAEPGWYQVESLDPQSRMVLRRRANPAGVALPATIEVHVVEDPIEAAYGLKSGLLDVLLEIESASLPRDLVVETFARSHETFIQVLRWHGRPSPRVTEAARRLRKSVDLTELCHDIYGDTARPVRNPAADDGQPAVDGDVTIRVAHNVENPLRRLVISRLRDVGRRVGVEVVPVETTFAELMAGADVDGSLATVADHGSNPADAMPAWPLTRHLDLPTMGRTHAGMTLVLGTEPIPASEVLSTWDTTLQEVRGYRCLSPK